MGRILAVDYGAKRTGLAVTDPLRIIATALETVPSADLLPYLIAYGAREIVDEFVVGMPKTLKNEDSQNAPRVRAFIEKLKVAFPGKPVHEVDERFTSSLAKHAMLESGASKKDRRDKGNVDKVSAVIILQSFMSAVRPG
ncbi:MAG TPA: Holliday junction resolvase RuvX [Chryseolinea sp.]|nr:Holliday junction resolvase RuvX [Chryseolinea sp.]